MDKGFYLDLANETISLLEEKGFRGTISADQIFARILSEVGELINAYKKGLPKQVQEDELADVVIYLFNIVDKAGIVGEVYPRWWPCGTRDLQRLSKRNPWKAMTIISVAVSDLEMVTNEDGSINKDLIISKDGYINYVNEILAACENCAEVLGLDLEQGI
ncbi:MAG TPA: hypothetical protein PKK61_11850, partial [Defluviitaleaceae bacterium]|nr:hypothetical protein [Defluviitaleaceae bacterium]